MEITIKMVNALEEPTFKSFWWKKFKPIGYNRLAQKGSAVDDKDIRVITIPGGVYKELSDDQKLDLKVFISINREQIMEVNPPILEWK